MTGRSLTRRFLVLTALRWAPVGLVIPVVVLLPLSRGLSLTEVGLVASLQGVVVLALELPTGALADSLGRRRILLTAAVVGVAATALLLTAHDVAAFAVVWALQGVHRALDSGPLEAWYVDEVQALDAGVAIDRGLSAQGVVVGLAIAGGALAGGALVALAPAGAEALALPVAASLALQLAGLVGVVLLMSESRPAAGPRGAFGRAPRLVAEGVGLLRGNRVLLALVAVELTWGFGMAAFESLTPVRIAEVAGDPERAAAITGPATAAAWAASSAGAAVLPLLGQRIGLAPTAALTRVLQGVTVVGIGLFGGVVGVVTAFLACYVVHGVADPAHMTLLHREVDATHRATVVSLNSMVSQPAAAVGIVALTALADASSLSLALVVAAVVLALGAPLYLPAWRRARTTEASSARG